MNIDRTIELPINIGDERLDTIIEILFAIQSGENLELSFKKTKKISPAGHAILFTILDMAAEHNRILQVAHVSKSLLLHPAIRDLQKNNQPIKNFVDIQKLKMVENDFLVYGKNNSIAPEFIEMLDQKFKHKIHEDRIWDISLILNELMQNIVDHSTSERYFIYAGINDERLEFGALDSGVTIPAKLEGKYQKENDPEYLKFALVKEVGTRKNRKGGMGLFYLVENIKDLSGRVVILSRKGQIRKNFGARHHTSGELKKKLSGTWCMASFPLERENENYYQRKV